ncbi:MAG: hypothetical protein LBL79_00255 [Prevotella sp.]|jgi:hypothetical protein|nr:hypothetical protein [Prevotella sp.]
MDNFGEYKVRLFGLFVKQRNAFAENDRNISYLHFVYQIGSPRSRRLVVCVLLSKKRIVLRTRYGQMSALAGGNGLLRVNPRNDGRKRIKSI